jgi:hypothetical protein
MAILSAPRSEPLHFWADYSFDARILPYYACVSTENFHRLIAAMAVIVLTSDRFVPPAPAAGIIGIEKIIAGASRP